MVKKTKLKEEEKEIERIYSSQVTPDLDGEEVFLQGWAEETRDLSKIRFLVLRDISGKIQVTAIKGKTPDKVFDEIIKIPKESVISVRGKVVKSKQSPGGREVLPDKIEIINKSLPILPIDISDFSKTELSKRLDWRSLSLRTKKSRFIFKIQAKLLEGMQEWLNDNGFLQIFTPCLMGIPAESGSEVFDVRYFDKIAFLRQDPQLHRQLSIAGGIERLYEIGPSWRAEKSGHLRGVRA